MVHVLTVRNDTSDAIPNVKSILIFLREKDDFYKKQTADKGSLAYNAYAAQKRRRQMDNAAKRGFKKPNYQKARYR